MVVMENIEDAAQWTTDTHGKNPKLTGQLEAALAAMSETTKYVHGDLRKPNVLVKEDKVFIIDFELSGELGKVRYPGRIAALFENVGGYPGSEITQQMDQRMVKRLLTGEY